MTHECVLDALADPTRRAVFERLRGGPLSVGEIAADLPVSRPAVSQHLRVLKDAGLVRDEAQGTRRLYEVDCAGLASLRRWIAGFGGLGQESAVARPSRRRSRPPSP